MFDNPEKELKRLEEELLKSDCADEDFEHFYRDIFAFFLAFSKIMVVTCAKMM